jgi:hypothetical protein
MIYYGCDRKRLKWRVVEAVKPKVVADRDEGRGLRLLAFDLPLTMILFPLRQISSTLFPFSLYAMGSMVATIPFF